MKVMTILGTRPEIIKLSRVMALLEEHTDHVLVHTGQNWDYELNQVFFDDLGVKKPDHQLEVDTSSLGTVYGEVISKAEKVLEAEKPDALLILGDTNSALSALMAKRMHIPIIHMEAGNRSFNWDVPEEVNRHVVDVLADINLVYTEHARRNLLDEGYPANQIYKTGSPLGEVIAHHRDQIESSSVLADTGLEKGEYLLVSLHREEVVDDLTVLSEVLNSITAVAEEHDVPVMVSLHPRTAKRLEEFGLETDERLRLQKPFGFFDYNNLQMNAKCVISDSGTIAVESAILGFPAVTPRVAFERPEAIDAGTTVLCGANAVHLRDAIDYALARSIDSVTLPEAYQVTDCSNKVLSVIMSRALYNRS